MSRKAVPRVFVYAAGRVLASDGKETISEEEGR